MPNPPFYDLFQSPKPHKIIGLLGAVLLAKSRGLIPLARPVIDRLRAEADFYLSQDILGKSLQSISE